MNKAPTVKTGRVAGRAAGRADSRRAEIAAVAADALSEVGFPGHTLAAGAEREVEAAIKGTVSIWRRFADGGGPAAPWPADGTFSAAVIRLPGGWEAFRMTLHAVCARLPAGAPLWIYGGAEEGITSVDSHLDGLAEGLETVALKKRTRVLRLARTAALAKGDKTDWRICAEIAAPGASSPLELAFYPGCFAAGRLDEGTRLLLEAAPAYRDGGRVLDFACGSGVVAAALRARTPDIRLALLDADALALDAARENVPGAEIILADGVNALPSLASGERFELIISNPPIHQGRQEDFGVLAALLEQGPKLLKLKGSLVFVVQRTAGAGRLIAAQGRKAALLKETPAFQVWRIGV